MFHHHNHKHHSPAMKLLGSVAWLLASLSAFAVGLAALGFSLGKNWDIWQSDLFLNRLAWLVQPLQYAIGIAGLLGLIGWFMCLGHCRDEKHK